MHDNDICEIVRIEQVFLHISFDELRVPLGLFLEGGRVVYRGRLRCNWRAEEICLEGGGELGVNLHISWARQS